LAVQCATTCRLLSAGSPLSRTAETNRHESALHQRPLRKTFHGPNLPPRGVDSSSRCFGDGDRCSERSRLGLCRLPSPIRNGPRRATFGPRALARGWIGVSAKAAVIWPVRQESGQKQKERQEPGGQRGRESDTTC
jgi:hypothetical protein